MTISFRIVNRTRGNRMIERPSVNSILPRFLPVCKP